MRKDFFFAAAVIALAAMPAMAQNSRIVEDGGTGPYKAIMMEEASLTTHTIFRPQDLSKFDKKNLLPVIVWGPKGQNLFFEDIGDRINTTVSVPLFYSGGEESPLPELPCQAKQCIDPMPLHGQEPPRLGSHRH